MYGSTAVLLLLPQRRPSGVRRTSKNKHGTRHVVHACRVMKSAIFVALLLFARDGIQRVIAPPAPVGRPAGKKSRAGAGKPGPPSQADERRKIVETKRNDSRWKRWTGYETRWMENAGLQQHTRKGGLGKLVFPTWIICWVDGGDMEPVAVAA